MHRARRRPQPRRWLLAISSATVAALILAPTAVAAASAVAETVVRVEALDAEGAPVEPAIGDLSLLEDGEPRRILAVEPVPGPWRVVVYLDQLFAEARTLRNAVVELSQRAAALTDLGTVEVVIAGDELRGALPPTRDPLVVSEQLSWLALREVGRDAQARLRSAFLEEFDTLLEPGGRPPLAALADLVEAARAAMAEEAALLRATRERLVGWIADGAGDRPGLLIFLSAGFDTDPREFYASALSRAGLDDLASSLVSPSVRPSLDQLERVLSAYGWVVVPYVPPTEQDAFLEAGVLPGDSGAGDEPEAPQEIDEEPTVEEYLDTVDLLKLARRRRGGDKAREAEVPLLSDPLQPLRQLAAATAGEVLKEAPALDAMLSRVGRRLEVTFVAGATPRSGLRRLELRARDEGQVRVRAPRWLAGDTPEVVSEVRARRILAGEPIEEEGELPVTAALRPGGGGLGKGELLVQLAAVDPRRARATVAVAWGEDEPSIFHRPLAEVAAAAAGREEDGALYTLPVSLPEGAGGRVAVVVEDLSTGRWGGTLASLLEALVEAGIDDLDILPLPAPRVIHLLAPDEALAVGPTVFRAVVSDAGVERVEFVLDGETVAEIGGPPYTATLDLGSLPQAREVEAVARGAGGIEMGRDLLVVNEGAGSFRVRIVEPRPERLREIGRVVGPLDVEAEVKAPRFAAVERVEFYWNTDLVATRFAEPFRQRIIVPADSPQGFVRVVAHLPDGSAREDVLFVNSPGSSERLEVNLVELYLVVTDRRGRPVRGLDREVFRIEEEGVEQEIATFSNAGDFPLTVGLVIDSSASMFVKLPEVQRAAADFVLTAMAPKDRAFVVGFGDEPRLTQDTTPGVPALVEGIGRLRPDGQTAVWKAIVYSLVQLQGVPGRKALIIYSDGADEDQSFPYRTCLRFARRLGVPIYVILANDEIYRTGGKSLGIRSYLGQLERLVEAVGGRLFITRVEEDLGEVYRQIAEELRSQYLLAYYPRARREDEWRPVRVVVDLPGLEARTISGYYR